MSLLPCRRQPRPQESCTSESLHCDTSAWRRQEHVWIPAKAPFPWPALQLLGLGPIERNSLGSYTHIFTHSRAMCFLSLLLLNHTFTSIIRVFHRVNVKYNADETKGTDLAIALICSHIVTNIHHCVYLCIYKTSITCIKQYIL